jgi:hypothetical protein
MRPPYLSLAFLACLVATAPGRADFVFQFADTSGTPTSTFTVNQGSTVGVNVYLVQQGGSTNLSSNGLVDGGVSLQFSSSGPFTISSASNITPNAAFAGANTTSLSTNAGTTTATLRVHDNSGVFAPTTGPDANRILLGTFTFSGVSPGTGLTVTALPDPNSANNVDGASTNLDSMIHNSSASITVTAVPEPGSLILTGLAASAFGFGAWRRRRRKFVALA